MAQWSCHLVHQQDTQAVTSNRVTCLLDVYKVSVDLEGRVVPGCSPNDACKRVFNAAAAIPECTLRLPCMPSVHAFCACLLCMPSVHAFCACLLCMPSKRRHRNRSLQGCAPASPWPPDHRTRPPPGQGGGRWHCHYAARRSSLQHCCLHARVYSLPATPLRRHRAPRLQALSVRSSSVSLAACDVSGGGRVNVA